MRPVIRHALVTNQSQVYLDWSAPSFDGNSPVQAYRVCSRHSEQSQWCNKSFPAPLHSATVDCLFELGHYYIHVVAVNNHGEGESEIRILDFQGDFRDTPTEPGFNT